MGNKTTPLYQHHVDLHAKIVDFSGWDMPLHYGSQIEEHHKVRQSAGVFDVSHMLVVDIQGEDAKAFLQYLLANDVARLKEKGKALYTCMLNERGGVVDDLIVYFYNTDKYRLVINAGCRDTDLAWINANASKFEITITPRYDLAMLAVQGPHVFNILKTIFPTEQFQQIEKLSSFQGVKIDAMFIARTGYTGEDGVEIMLPQQAAIELWEKLLAAEVAPCGLGARDTLRLEAGLNLYGSDMTDSTTPLESNLAWTVALNPADRNFIGRTALEQQKQKGLRSKLVGLVLQDRGVLRSHQTVIVEGVGEGEITSGTFSPTLGFSIGLARVPTSTGDHCYVDIRGKHVAAKVVKPPFVRQGKKLV